MNDSTRRNLESRRSLLIGLRAEVIGPDPCGDELEQMPSRVSREDERDGYIAIRQKGGEEILTRDSPARRYGAGVLYPPEGGPATTGTVDVEGDVDAQDLGVSDTESEDREEADRSQKRARDKEFGTEGDDLAITATNSFKPCAMGVSLVVDLDALSRNKALTVTIANCARMDGREVLQSDCGFYQPHELSIGEGDTNQKRTWWLRRPFRVEGQLCSFELNAELLEASGFQDFECVGFAGRLRVQWHIRRWPEAQEGHRLLTLTLRNVSPDGGGGGVDARSLFQSGLVVSVPERVLVAYPRALLPFDEISDPLDDEKVNRLIYASRQTYAVGHGCSADWDSASDGSSRLWTDVMPAHEMAPMAFEVMDSNGAPLRLPMRDFAEMPNADAPAFARLEQLVGLYEAWIDQLPQSHTASGLEATAAGLIGRCREAAKRMREGLDLLRDSRGKAFQAFALANKAMLMAQHRRAGDARQPEFDTAGSASWPVSYHALDLGADDTKQRESDSERPVGLWRPFQLAFLLMSLEGIVFDNGDDRETVDLIWFPTGGGKTEAYLGLAAFTVFYNTLSKRVALRDDQPSAVSILMRYTLRLLTAQQFQRAVTLFCAMEILRTQEIALGSKRFTVGLWVGSSSTPNNMKNEPGSKGARRALSLMKGQVQPQEGEAVDANPFVLLQCPWCGAGFGRQPQQQGYRAVHGYSIAGKGDDARFVYVCPDPKCEFGLGMDLRVPALIVDDNLYSTPPTLLIGTVDKFAMLAWKAEARSLFGIGGDGSRIARGPEFVIQDELHLMTGPLGTMVGLFETVIEGLCRHGGGLPPKIIASTATAARASDQVQALYARKEMRVFPPPGLDAADSFFAKEDPGKPGRLYVGVLAPGHGSMQTTQRHTYAALLQGAADIAMTSCHGGTEAQRDAAAVEAADPWWTLLAYYNSLRELGGALTLFGADIPDQLDVIRSRKAMDFRAKRKVHVDGRVLELTSRIDSGDVPDALRKLEHKVHKFLKQDDKPTAWAEFGPQDACLASNIIEVGVDVPRLSLMAIVGQPKTTSAYIQASSRIGRREDRPGLVVVLYSSTKPRDRSHYERFRAYHQSIYAWVEPTSVTPFSPPAVARALHAVMVALVRQTSNPESQSPDQAIAAGGLDWIRELVRSRAETVARADEVEGANTTFGRLLAQWRSYNPARWGKALEHTVPPPSLLFAAGTERPPQWGNVGWSTPTSLRAVDATCQAEVSQYYADLAANQTIGDE